MATMQLSESRMLQFNDAHMRHFSSMSSGKQTYGLKFILKKKRSSDLRGYITVTA